MAHAKQVVASATAAAAITASSLSCDGASSNMTSQQRRGSANTAVQQYIGYIWAVSGVGIISILALSVRSAVRSDRATTVIDACEKIIVKNSTVLSVAGPVFAAGSFAIDTGNPLGKSIATGWYNATASGGVRGRVYVDAWKEARSRPWEFTYVRLYIDKKGLASRNRDRRAQAVAAGYLSEAEATAQNNADDLEVREGVVGESRSGEAEHIAPGVAAVQLVGIAREHDLPDFAEMAKQARESRAR